MLQRNLRFFFSLLRFGRVLAASSLHLGCVLAPGSWLRLVCILATSWPEYLVTALFLRPWLLCSRHSSIRAAEGIAFVLRNLLDCGTQHYRFRIAGRSLLAFVARGVRSYCEAFVAFGWRDDYLRHLQVVSVCVILASSLRI
jgi:hypothetical protein